MNRFHFPSRRLLCGCAGLFLTGAAAIPALAQTSPSPSQQVAAAQQREQVLKQQEVFRITPTLVEAKKLEDSGDYDKARQIYLSALNTLTPAPATQGLYDQAAQGLIRCNDQLIEQAREKADLATMETLLKESLNYDPNNARLKAELAKVEEARRNPNDVALYVNPATNDHFKKKVDTVQSLFDQAEQARRTGQYDLATDRLNAILVLDPYNKGAEEALDRINKEKLTYQKVATDESREQHLREVEQGWANPVHTEEVEAVSPTATLPLTRSNEFEVDQKLKSIVIPQVDFTDASLQNAVDFLNDTVRQLDPSHVGINFIPQPEAIRQAKPITLSLKNVPLGDVLRYLTQLAQVKFKIDQSAILFVPLTTGTDTLVRRQFNVAPSFFTVTTAPTDNGDNGGAVRRRTTPISESSAGGSLDVKDQLQQRGVEFTAEGSNAIYLASSGVLEVVDSQDQMDLIEELVNAATGQTLMVNIEARFIEINQTDLNDVTFNWNLYPLSGSITTPSFAAQMRGVNGLSQNNLTALVNTSQVQPGALVNVSPNGGPPTPIPNSFLLSGIMDGKVYQSALEALAQKTSSDLLASPSVRVRSGERATIDATRTFYYPTSYDAPQIITITTTTLSTIVPSPAAAIPAFPSAFDKQEIGVILNAQPTVGGDSRTIDLSLVPEITDFQGFINYGSPITVTTGVAGAAPKVLVQNQILQPVFNVRRVTTKVFLRDGYTVVLGGLIREDIQSIDDKVPFLGDLPVVGRLFKSKVKQSIKKNLLIFVTGTIVRPDGERFNPPEEGAPGSVAVAAP